MKLTFENLGKKYLGDVILVDIKDEQYIIYCASTDVFAQLWTLYTNNLRKIV